MEVITDPVVAYEKGELLSPPRKFEMGNVSKAFKKCKYVFEGTAESGGQEHVYLEPQGAYALPNNNGTLRIWSSTQGPTAVQRTVARILNITMHKIEVDVGRIGGGFGGKEDQASAWAAVVALGSYLTKRPVKYILERSEDLQMTGKRNPYKSKYKIGLSKDLKIKAFEATYYQNGGAAADLSPAILERTLFHATNSYFVPNVSIEAFSCRTNLPPNTAFRGFGGPQGMFVIESAIHHAARQLGKTPLDIQTINLVNEGDEFSYGQKANDSKARPCWDQAMQKYQIDKIQKEIQKFNTTHSYLKKGMHAMPVCFGISFTNTQMNNARALVHVYGDGSVGISTGAVEMGQGVSTKMVQVAARSFGLPIDSIHLETTNTTRVANTSPSAASATADLNGKALQDACDQIVSRLKKLILKEFNIDKSEVIEFKEGRIFGPNKTDLITWKELIFLALSKRTNLSAKGHYATPKIHFDKKKEKGRPFAYYVYGTAIFICTVDCIRGNYEFDSVQIVHDFGASMNRGVDLGQIEGGLVQGMGWMTTEEIIYNEKGELKSGSLANYKIPDIYSVPKIVDVQYLKTKGHDLAILKSKAVGEPPLMYGIGTYFALYNAILAYNPNTTLPYSAPMTAEKVMKGLYGFD
jgi:xanthine dehydrogenase large subunit